MGLLDALLGGGRGGEEHQGFLQRFEQGQPWEGYTDQEVLTRYASVAGQATPEEYEQAASDTFSRLSPEQRVEFGRLLQQRAREQHVDIGGLTGSGVGDFQDARRLARLTSDVHQQPGLLRSMLGGGGPAEGAQGQQAGLLGHPLAKAALAGIAAMAIKRVLGARAAAAGAGSGTQPTGRTTTGAGIDIPSPPPAQQPGASSAQAAPAATTAAPPSQAATAERWHQVVSGDSLSKLAAKYYGDGRQWMRIFEANRDSVTDPDRIKIGQRLRIP